MIKGDQWLPEDKSGTGSDGREGLKEGNVHVHYFHCSDDFIGVSKRQNFTNFILCVMLIICQIFLHKSVFRNLSGVPSINY